MFALKAVEATWNPETPQNAEPRCSIQKHAASSPTSSCAPSRQSFPKPPPPAAARFALVIGNGNYGELSKLANPANDAGDMAAALKELGFHVDLLTDASMGAMEDAVVRLGDELAASPNSTGFFYYAGHGLQSGGTNYLIPADAHIPSEAFLKNRALAAQEVLDTLQVAKNVLNVVVLDACRDNPFGWSRSGTRGLQIVGNQPSGSIIVYATSAGSVAQDGTGRNGVFTQELLKNLKTPGLEVKEVFNRTGAGVKAATGGKQVPAVYSQFFDMAYLGDRSSEAAVFAVATTADLMVKASQPGLQDATAEIFVDGESQGMAPLLVQALPAGRLLKVEVKSPTSYASMDLKLISGELREVSLTMVALKGNLLIASSSPDAVLFVDGAKKGPLGSGAFRDLAIGAHDLELRGKGLHWTGTVEVRADSTTRVEATLRAVAAATLRFPSLGIPAELRVDGNKVDGKIENGHQLFSGIPSDWPVAVTLSWPGTSIPEFTTTYSFAPGETKVQAIPAGRLSLPWTPTGTTVTIAGLGFATTSGQSWQSPELPAGQMDVSVAGPVGLRSKSMVVAGTSTEVSGYREAALGFLAAKNSAVHKSISFRKTTRTLGIVSLATGAVSVLAGGVVYLLGADAGSRYAAATDSATAASLRTQSQTYGNLLGASLGVAGATLALAPRPLVRRPRRVRPRTQQRRT